jgi:hypothetical protein
MSLLRGEEVVDEIPELYATEDVPLEKKMIYQKGEIPEIGFYWLIAELDRKKNIAFGYANLNNDDFAEGGYISMEQLIDNGASLDRNWKHCTFGEAEERMRGKDNV